MTDVHSSNAKDCPDCGTPMLWKFLAKDRCPQCEPLEEDHDDLFDFQWALSEKIGHHEDLDCGEIASELSKQFRITRR